MAHAYKPKQQEIVTDVSTIDGIRNVATAKAEDPPEANIFHTVPLPALQWAFAK